MSVAPHDALLGFGKHRDKTLREAVTMPEVVEWAFKINNPKGKLADFVAYVKEHGTPPAPKVAEKVATAAAEAPAKEAPPPAAAAADDDDSEEDVPLSSRQATGGKKITADKRKAEQGAGANGKAKQPRTEPEAAGTENEPPADAAGADGDEEVEEDLMGTRDAVAMAVYLAKSVIARGERGDEAGVLSVLGVPITKETPFEEQRKAFRGLAKLLHPDKLSRHFAGATKAFQFVTEAFENLSAPEPEGAKAKANGPTVGRSNEGCVRTVVRCPRCKALWGTPQSGLEPYEYTFFMQGLRTYICCGCLLRFGCMSADHHCPHPECAPTPEEPHKGMFAYNPKKFHNTQKCMNCKKEGRDHEFGFKLFTTGPRIDARVRAEVLERLASRKKKADNDAYRSQRKPVAVPASQQLARDEVLYRVGLLAACPRCGHTGCGQAEGAAGEKARSRHLAKCTDEEKHRAYRKAKKAAAKDAALRVDMHAENNTKQSEVEALAAWQFLGGDAQHAWMLTDTQLAGALQDKGLEKGGGGREEMLTLLASSSASSSSASAGGAKGGGGSAGGGGGANDAAQSVPDNLQGYSVTALRELCAAHGLVAKAGCTKDQLVALLERRKYGGEVYAMLEAKAPKETGQKAIEDAGAAGAAAADEHKEEEDDAAGDEEYKEPEGEGEGEEEDDEEDDDVDGV